MATTVVGAEPWSVVSDRVRHHYNDEGIADERTGDHSGVYLLLLMVVPLTVFSRGRVRFMACARCSNGVCLPRILGLLAFVCQGYSLSTMTGNYCGWCRAFICRINQNLDCIVMMKGEIIDERRITVVDTSCSLWWARGSTVALARIKGRTSTEI